MVTEVHGLIGDLLLNENFSDGADHKLKRIKDLLAPKVNIGQYSPKVIVGMFGHI